MPPGSDNRVGVCHGRSRCRRRPHRQVEPHAFDTTHGAEFIDAPARLSRYRALFESIDSAALPQDASLDLIRSIAQEL
ncbi:Scr1 family TA system antitoxin-like transcriptional regulator [Streptomyces bobili]|uniref:Scr1 family TA system antitoxin-like transcriptional regulator n=1 Tax=Streptomyces bobili TaxID=67280 RepID=UPI00343687AD